MQRFMLFICLIANLLCSRLVAAETPDATPAGKPVAVQQSQPDGISLAEIKFAGEKQAYAGEAYRFLGDRQIQLTIPVAPQPDQEQQRDESSRRTHRSAGGEVLGGGVCVHARTIVARLRPVLDCRRRRASSRRRATASRRCSSPSPFETAARSADGRQSRFSMRSGARSSSGLKPKTRL